jgi:hypothetical protein
MAVLVFARQLYGEGSGVIANISNEKEILASLHDYGRELMFAMLPRVNLGIALGSDTMFPNVICCKAIAPTVQRWKKRIRTSRRCEDTTHRQL